VHVARHAGARDEANQLALVEDQQPSDIRSRHLPDRIDDAGTGSNLDCPVGSPMIQPLVAETWLPVKP
jgi:hypothetical protein